MQLPRGEGFRLGQIQKSDRLATLARRNAKFLAMPETRSVVNWSYYFLPAAKKENKNKTTKTFFSPVRLLAVEIFLSFLRFVFFIELLFFFENPWRKKIDHEKQKMKKNFWQKDLLRNLQQKRSKMFLRVRKKSWLKKTKKNIEYQKRYLECLAGSDCFVLARARL